MNVVINQTAADLNAASDGLARAVRIVAGREVLDAAALVAVRQKIGSARYLLDKVEAEVTAPRTGLTIDRATWDDRNEIAAERAAAKGVA